MRVTASRLPRVLRLCSAALALLLVLPAGTHYPGVAHAQQAGERQTGGGILRFLFQRSEPPRRDRVVAPPPGAEAPRRANPTVRRTQPGPVAAPAEPAVEKAENAKRVLVVGDFLAGGMADGLEVAFEQNPNVLVVNRSNGSSGLVRDDYYDWPGSVGSMIEMENPSAVVVMIGSNDRQQMRVDGNREPPRTEAWTAEYERRATALVKAIRDRNLPLIWVGNLPFRPGAMSSDMIAFNDLYRRIVTDAGGEFVDVWDGFVDETGAFAANGPDMNGQPAQLRSSDGINVTRQGRRKIAFYVEKPLNRLLDLGTDASGVARLGPDSELLGAPSVEEAAPAVIDRTAPMALDDVSADAASGLLGALVQPASGEAHTAAEKLSREGVGPEATPGRADDFQIRRQKAPAQPDPGRTSAVTR